MRRRIIFSLIAMVGILVGLLSVGYFRNMSVQADCEYNPTSLIDGKIEQVEETARNYACSYLAPKVPSTVRLAEFMTPQEYMSHFGFLGSVCDTQKLAFVILEGDFGWDLPGLGQLSSETRAKLPSGKFVGMVIDLRTGTVFDVTRSDGSNYREILNDPSLPESTLALVPAPASLPQCRGTVDAPPVNPPSN